MFVEDVNHYCRSGKGRYFPCYVKKKHEINGLGNCLVDIVV
jgi:hypothetical protein